MKPTLEAPGIKLLKLTYDKPLTNFAFFFNLRRYTKKAMREAAIVAKEALDREHPKDRATRLFAARARLAGLDPAAAGLRMACFRLSTHPWFEGFVLFLICVSGAVLVRRYRLTPS